jgi:hypothetical protein
VSFGAFSMAILIESKVLFCENKLNPIPIKKITNIL